MLIGYYSWAANCAANADTNGIDFNANGVSSGSPLPAPLVVPPPAAAPHTRARLAKGNIITVDSTGKPGSAVGLPAPFHPTIPLVAGGEGVIQSYILPDNKEYKKTGGVSRHSYS